MLEIYDDKETQIMFNKSVNEFYTRILFEVDSLPHDVTYPLDISSTLFNNSSTVVREFFISEGVQVPPMPPTETNQKGNHRLLLVRNAAAEAKKKIRK